MLGLPQSTEVKRPMPKAQLYKKFELKQTQRDAFDADVARMEIVNFIAPQSLPGIAEGTEVKAGFCGRCRAETPRLRHQKHYPYRQAHSASHYIRSAS